MDLLFGMMLNFIIPIITVIASFVVSKSIKKDYPGIRIVPVFYALISAIFVFMPIYGIILFGFSPSFALTELLGLTPIIFCMIKKENYIKKGE